MYISSDGGSCLFDGVHGDENCARLDFVNRFLVLFSVRMFVNIPHLRVIALDLQCDSSIFALFVECMTAISVQYMYGPSVHHQTRCIKRVYSRKTCKAHFNLRAGKREAHDKTAAEAVIVTIQFLLRCGKRKNARAALLPLAAVAAANAASF
jgi:hypothetical protein